MLVEIGTIDLLRALAAAFPAPTPSTAQLLQLSGGRLLETLHVRIHCCGNARSRGIALRRSTAPMDVFPVSPIGVGQERGFRRPLSFASAGFSAPTSLAPAYTRCYCIPSSLPDGPLSSTTWPLTPPRVGIGLPSATTILASNTPSCTRTLPSPPGKTTSVCSTTPARTFANTTQHHAT